MARAGSGPIAFSCECGTLRGHLTNEAIQSGTRVKCHCPDCRASELYFDQPNPAPGPVDILQMSPDGIIIEQGREQLAMMRLGPNGLFRWYARCCNSPIATTLKSAKLPFAGFNVLRLSNPDKLGPVVTEGFVPTPDGKRKHKNAGCAAYGLFSRLLAARLSGRWRDTPFFDPDSGAPVAKATILTKEERAALYR